MPAPMLETERLILRLPEASDLEPWTEMMSDPVASLHLGGPMNRHMTWRSLCAMRGSWELYGYAMFSVVEKASGRWVGRLGPWVPADWPGTEVGWSLHPAAWGKGYATEGAAAAIDWAFDTLGWSEVIHCIDPANVGSIRVAERLGSKNLRKGRAPAPFDTIDFDLWGQTRTEWLVNRKRFMPN